MEDGDQTGPDEEHVLELLDELVSLWRDRDGAPVRIAVRDHQAVGLAMFGLTTHAANACASIVTLYRAGESATLAALARQVIEACVTVVWVELCGQTAAEALMAEQSRQLINEFNDFVKLGMSGTDAALKSLNADKNWFLAHGAGRHVEQRCKEIAGGDALYAVYRAASELSHASTAVVDMYLHEPPPGSRAPVALQYEPNLDLRPWLTSALVLFVHAGLSFDRSIPNTDPARDFVKLHASSASAHGCSSPSKVSGLTARAPELSATDDAAVCSARQPQR